MGSPSSRHAHRRGQELTQPALQDHDHGWTTRMSTTRSCRSRLLRFLARTTQPKFCCWYGETRPLGGSGPYDPAAPQRATYFITSSRSYWPTLAGLPAFIRDQELLHHRPIPWRGSETRSNWEEPRRRAARLGGTSGSACCPVLILHRSASASHRAVSPARCGHRGSDGGAGTTARRLPGSAVPMQRC